MKSHGSTHADKNPYQRSTSVNQFWENNPMYSEKSKEYFRERLTAFILAEQNSKRVQWIKR